MMDSLNQSYSDALAMPTIERRFHIQTLIEKNAKAKAESKSGEEVVKTGKHSQVRKIRGSDVSKFSGQV